MNHKAKSEAGGFVILYKTWRHDRKSKRQGERPEKYNYFKIGAGKNKTEQKTKLLFFLHTGKNRDGR